MLMIIIWWFVDAHKWFKGPKVLHTHFFNPLFHSPLSRILSQRTYISCCQVNIEHQMLGREGNIVDGKGDESEGSSAGSITKEKTEFDDKKAADFA